MLSSLRKIDELCHVCFTVPLNWSWEQLVDAASEDWYANSDATEMRFRTEAVGFFLGKKVVFWAQFLENQICKVENHNSTSQAEALVTKSFVDQFT